VVKAKRGRCKRDAQAGTNDSLEDIGSRVASRMAIQGAGTGPRRTGSGKSVKYRDD
jgi:hypothetical protein